MVNIVPSQWSYRSSVRIVKTKQKSFAHPSCPDAVSGSLKIGQLVAVLGASGAGKTTLLACIAQRFRGPLQGDLMINGNPIDRKTMTKISCFVPQFDITIDSLTPAEHLYFMGELKFDRKWSKARKNQRIEYLLREIGLQHVADTRISRLSGGERKKLNLATDVSDFSVLIDTLQWKRADELLYFNKLECWALFFSPFHFNVSLIFSTLKLLTDPLILVCDEPTTGLDSFNARTVVKTLKDLATPHSASSINETEIDGIELQTLQKQTTPKAIICSIHQPTSDIFQCFSHIMLMHNGRCVFQGTAQEAADHFARFHIFRFQKFAIKIVSYCLYYFDYYLFGMISVLQNRIYLSSVI